MGARAAVQGGPPTRWGYSAAHRREDGASGMNTDLTDAEWALVADLFERAGSRGTPTRYERRHIPVVAQACTKIPGLKKFYADGAYGGQCAVAIEKAHGVIVLIDHAPSVARGFSKH